MASFWHLDTVRHHIFWDTDGDEDDDEDDSKPIATEFLPALKRSESVSPSDFVFFGGIIVIIIVIIMIIIMFCCTK